MSLRQAVNRFRQQLRSRVVMRVKLFVNISTLQTEIRAEIDYLTSEIEQRSRIFSGNAVRQREENDLRFFRDQFRFRFAETQRFRPAVARELWENLRERLSGVLTRG